MIKAGIDEAIYESNKIICRQISRLGQSTRGEVSQEVIESLRHFVEHILLKVYAKGSDIEDTRENIQAAVKFAKSGVDLTIRVPVIPTFNNTPQEIRAIAEFAKSLPGVKKLHLLPYHRLGQGKYEGLGREYTLKEIEPIEKSYMEMLLREARKSGLYCQIGC